ncbi:unnamed protein product, partial [Mesorhabditis spiculigera]
MSSYLPVSERESAWVFLTEGDTEAAVLDLNGVYVLLDGGAQAIDMFSLFRSPELAVLSTSAPSTLANVAALNDKQVNVPVLGKVPRSASGNNSDTARLIQRLSAGKTNVITPKPVDVKKIEPFVAFKSLRTGTLEIYVLHAEPREFDALQKAVDAGDEQKILDAARVASMISLIVFVPVAHDKLVKRILHTGNASYEKIVAAVDKLKTLPLVTEPTITVEQYRKGGTAKPPPKIAAPARVPAAAAKPTPSARPPTAKPNTAPTKPVRTAPVAPSAPRQPSSASRGVAASSRPSATTSSAARPVPAKSTNTRVPPAAPEKQLIKKTV